MTKKKYKRKKNRKHSTPTLKNTIKRSEVVKELRLSTYNRLD